MRVLLTGVTHNAALVAMRALAGRGFCPIGADYRLLPFGLQSRYSEKYQQILSPTESGFEESLLACIRKTKPDVYLPFGTKAPVCRIKKRIAELTRTLLPDEPAFVSLHDKLRIVEQCARHGIRTPRIMPLDEAKAALRTQDVAGVIIKPRQNLGGGEGVRAVFEEAELDDVFSKAERYGEPFVSEYIPGKDAANIALQLLFDHQSRLIGQFAMRKTRLQPAGVGMAAAAVSVHVPELVAQVRPLFEDIGWEGPADIDYKIDERSGQPYLIEVNGRFSGGLPFAIGCGVDLPYLACRAALGECMPEADAPAYEAGIHYWNPAMYTRAVFAALSRQETRRGLVRQVRRELSPPRVGSPYSFTDPAPLLGKLLLPLFGSA